MRIPRMDSGVSPAAEPLCDLKIRINGTLLYFFAIFVYNNPNGNTEKAENPHQSRRYSLIPFIMFCNNCGKEIADNAIMCPTCGAPIKKEAPATLTDTSEKDWLTTLLLCFFLGGLGIHSFYVGKTGIGIVQLLTLGGCGIWTLIDFIMIICGNYKDAQGKPILNKR